MIALIALIALIEGGAGVNDASFARALIAPECD
jgi:hypothetical protein